MYQTTDPLGRPFLVPEHQGENSAGFAAAETVAARAYYEEQGYVVVRGLLSPTFCDLLRSAFAATVKPYAGYLYRQTTANPEKNCFNEQGFVMNPIQNLQDLPTKPFAPLKALALEAYTARHTMDLVESVIGARAKIVQTMYFEGNAATWAHQDTYYLDSEMIGGMVGVWFALEDIDAGAGRFYVVPRSHRLDIERNGGEIGVAHHHGRYKEMILRLCSEQGYEFRAPFLAKGDVLLWNACTIHGSLATTRQQVSRSSLTAHYIPASQRLLQFQRRIKPLKLKRVNGVEVHCPKDLDRPGNRAILAVETRFPRSFQRVKRMAIAALTR